LVQCWQRPPGIKEGFAKIGATGFARQQAVLSTQLVTIRLAQSAQNASSVTRRLCEPNGGIVVLRAKDDSDLAAGRGLKRRVGTPASASLSSTLVSSLCGRPG
jgi:hypothetical protein